MQRKAATASDWKTTPMPEAHAEFTFHRSFTQEQMELLRYGNIPQAMEDKWFWYYEDDKLYIHRSWTGFCIFVVSFTPDSDELHVLVNRDPEQYRSTDVNQDEYELNRLLTWWTQSDYDPYNQFLADTYRALLPLMQKDQKPTVEEKKQGCLYGGAAGDALGYAVEFLSLDQIRSKYGPDGIQYYELKDGRACFSDDTQMLLFTLEGIYLWQDKLRKRHDGAKLKNCLFDAYRDWVYTQENDGLPKDRHKPHTQLYLIPSMHRRMGPGFTCMRSLRSKRAGSIENPLNDSKGNGGVMRVAPIGFYFPRNVYSLEADVTFAVMSDLHMAAKPGRIRRALRHAAEADCILLPGDLTNDATPEQFHCLWQLIEETVPDRPLLPVCGNHDFPMAPLPLIWQGIDHYGAFQECALNRAQQLGVCWTLDESGAYRAVFRDTEIFGLNAVSHWRRFTFPEGKQMDWLKKQLGKDARRRTVLCHAPLIRHNPLRSESDAPYLARDAQLQQIVDDTGKVLFLSGHTHLLLNEGRGCVEYDAVHGNLYLNDSSITPTLPCRQEPLGEREWADEAICYLSLNASGAEIRARCL